MSRVTGDLLGDWDRVPASLVVPYRAMVEAMARAGVDTGGRPPVWAWRGELRLIDAISLFDAEHELSRGFATVEFDAPEHLAVASDYGRWNDFLAASLEGRECAWEPGPAEREPVQVCLPYLLADWVRDVRPLPTGGWDRLDLAAAV
ncbi:hypothetical protein [Amycolatopsis deserti]|uniref:hypothetical protein n=1 Tax=Amycolatopsis deserti TaxID=185696 RepID=UPI00174BFC85|nr:hypothetical protein [Amycolatopsis deserti]